MGALVRLPMGRTTLGARPTYVLKVFVMSRGTHNVEDELDWVA